MDITDVCHWQRFAHIMWASHSCGLLICWWIRCWIRLMLSINPFCVFKVRLRLLVAQSPNAWIRFSRKHAHIHYAPQYVSRDKAKQRPSNEWTKFVRSFMLREFANIVWNLIIPEMASKILKEVLCEMWNDKGVVRDTWFKPGRGNMTVKVHRIKIAKYSFQ